jgi:hypothetical protein
MATLTWTDGEVYDVPDENVSKALAAGFKQASSEDLARSEARSSPIKAGVESAVRNLVPVAGQDILTQFQIGQTGQTEEEVVKAQNLRKQENPIASTIGAGVGFVAGPGKVLKPLTTPLRAAGLVGTASAGALEGTAMGLTEAVNESVLENQPLTAERLTASAMGSALTGGVIDFGFGVVGKGISALIKKAGSSSLSEFLRSKGDDISASMIDSKKWAKRYGAFEEDILKVAREEGVLTRGTALDDASVQAAKAAEQRIWGQISDHLESAQYFDPPKPQQMFDEVMGNLKKYERDPFAQVALKEVQSTLDTLVGQNATWGELWSAQGRWRRIADVGSDTIRNDVIDDARRSLRDFIMENAPKKLAAAQGAPELGASLRKLNQRYAAMDAFEKGLSDATAGFNARGLGFKEIAAGVAVGGVPGVATVAAGRLARKRGGFLVGETLNAMSESGLTQGIADSFRRNVMQRLSVAPELLGTFRATLEAAAARGSMDLMETHFQLANSTVGEEYMTTMGMSPEGPEEMDGMSQRLAALDAVKRAADAQELQLSAAADGLFGSTPGRKSGLSVSDLSPKEFEKTVKGLRDIIADPERMFANIPPEMHGAAPLTAGQTAASMLNAARYLDSKAPKNPYEGMPPAIAPQWAPSAAELDQFNRYREAVVAPASVLKNLAKGYIAPEQVEALQAVYPQMYAKLQQQITERMMMLKKPLEYQQRLALAAIIGPGALSMSPQQVQILQEAQGLAAGQESGQGKAMKGPDGRQDVNEAQIQTESQKLEARA